MKKGWRIAKYAAFGVLGVLAVGLFGWITMLLWNWLVPALFSGPVVTFWQALGLLVLSKILFGSIGKGGHQRGGSWRHYYWRRKWGGMTPEEREAFRSKMKDKWCYREPDALTKDSGTSSV